MRHYCHNCGRYRWLPQLTLCQFCLRFWQANLRMPLDADMPHRETSLQVIYHTMGWKAPDVC
jgi:hypothetical protein